MKNLTQWSCVLLCVWLTAPLHARDILALRINVAFSGTPVAVALDEIAEKGRFQWSYNANILDPKAHVTYTGYQQSVREVLHEVLGNAYTFRQNGEYLILKKVKRPEQHLTGYLSDQKTGKRIPNATIYDRQSLKSAVTDAEGFYELSVPPGAQIAVATLAYRDTILRVSPITPQLFKIEMQPDSSIGSDSRHSLPYILKEDAARVGYQLERFFRLQQQHWNEINTGHDSLHRVFQVSFLPNIGTNRYMSGSVVNDFSLNILAGYSKGNRILEIGGLANMDRGNVSGVQIAGLSNIVTGDMRGVQIAGLTNNVRGNALGVQIGGLYNEGDTTHIQIGGLTNVSRFQQGPQIGGVVNYAKKSNAAIQIGGVANTVAAGAAVAQIGGVSNVADTVRGVQVSGVVNVAKVVKGAQIGLINRADSISGVQLGLFNMAKKGGYMALEVSANEINSSNLTFKTGTPQLYTIWTGGASPEPVVSESERLWTFGMGIGSHFWAKKRMSLSVDLIQRHLDKGDFDEDTQEWTQLAIGANLRLGRHWYLAAGPSLNMLYAQDHTFHGQMIPKDFPDFSIGNNSDLRGWAGAVAAVRYRW